MRLFDTSFVVDLVNGDPGAVRLAGVVDEEASLAAISVVTVYEYLLGIHLRFGKGHRDVLSRKLEEARDELDRFEVMPLSREIAELAAGTEAELETSGRQIGVNDTYIAATALKNGMPVVTRNRAHFERVPNLKVEGY